MYIYADVLFTAKDWLHNVSSPTYVLPKNNFIPFYSIIYLYSSF